MKPVVCALAAPVLTACAATLEESNAMPLRAFDKSDKNKDGRLTPYQIEKVKAR